MMYVLLAVVFLLLGVGGILAYKNSKLITNIYGGGSGPRRSSLMYSVYNHSTFDAQSEAVQLFQVIVPSGINGIHSVENVGTTLILCRVSEGKGELILADAQSWMLNNIRQAAITGVPIQHEAFADNALSNGERMLIVNLEEAVKEAANLANHH
ncbi:MAG: hypothetical protein K6T94_12070 [Paenibacillus sp.]|nr:hypothetical protein [Paenibacillus sp.]